MYSTSSAFLPRSLAAYVVASACTESADGGRPARGLHQDRLRARGAAARRARAVRLEVVAQNPCAVRCWRNFFAILCIRRNSAHCSGAFSQFSGTPTSTSTHPSARGAAAPPRAARRGLLARRRSCSSAAPRSTPTSAATRRSRAAMNRRYSTVELLLRWEANAARVGRDGKTADEWCAHVGHAHLAARLAQAAAKAATRLAQPVGRRRRVGPAHPRRRDGLPEDGLRPRAAGVGGRRAADQGGEQRAYKAGDFVVHDASRGQYATDASPSSGATTTRAPRRRGRPPSPTRAFCGAARSAASGRIA